MPPAQELLRPFIAYLPPTATFFFFLVIILALHRYGVRRRRLADVRHTIVPQLLMVLSAALGIVFTIAALPLTETTRGQMLALMGVVFTGMIALSSTTFVTNALAGLMLRLIRHFRAGDFIRINDRFGRVTERGLFHTEIQTPESDLTTLPNLYLISHPHTVVRASGTIISASLSLGYDLDHNRIEPLLLAAATQTGLEDPFVQITELGDFAVTYKVSGFLVEVKQFLAVQSSLRRKLLDVLHRDGVEIVSPRFMNQRVLDPRTAVVPIPAPETAPGPDEEAPLPEAMIFDKAETAEKVVQMTAKLAELAEKKKSLLKRKDAAAEKALAHIEQTMEKLERLIEQKRKDLEAEAG